MTPPFELQGGLALACARATSVGATLSIFGALTFETLIAPKAYARMDPDETRLTQRRLNLVVVLSLIGAVLGTCAWLILESAHFADAETLSETLAAIWPVVAHTFFGHVVVAQCTAFAVLAGIFVTRNARFQKLRSAPAAMLFQRTELAVAAAALILQSGHSHAYSMYDGPSLVLGADVLHLLGAGAWLGGLLPLILLVMSAPPKAGAIAARWFSPLGKWCIAALTVSAAYQGWVLVASIPGLIGTAYGWLVVAKLVLSLVLLGFAAANRYVWAPALLRAEPAKAKRNLVRSIALQSGFAIAIVVAAAILSSLPPAMHEQPLWPFAQRISLAAVSEDPDFRREVLIAASGLGAALLLLLAAIFARRFRLPAAAIAALAAWFAIPHFDLLLAEAYPTSFYRSPTGFAAASIVAGATVFSQNCTACHGTGGQGDGPAAKTLPVPPADLTAAHLWMHSDGELFWWISHGMETPEGQQAMPGFAATLTDDQRWAVIDYIRANNAGTLQRTSNRLPPAIAAPGFEASCGQRHLKLADFHGKFIRLAFGFVPSVHAPQGTVTIATVAPAAAVPPGDCTIEDETVPTAYAIVSGIPAAHLPGAQFLIDSDGWLRAVQPAGAQPGWNTATALNAELANLRAHPVNAAAGQDSMGMQMPMNMKMPGDTP